MFGTGNKDNPMNWSFRIGQLFGIDIRLHIVFLFAAAILVGRAFAKPDESIGLSSPFDALIAFFILFAMVLLHEFGHCWGARRSGGDATEVLLWPLGGLAMVRPPHTPKANLLTAAAGPAVNVLICIVAAAILIALGGLGAVPWNPLRTFMPIDSNIDVNESTQFWLRIVFGLSYLLLLFNLLPVFPMDGGRMLQAILWERRGYGPATMTATFIGMVGAIVFAVFGILTGAMLMIGFGIFGYITCYHERRLAKMRELDGGVNEFGYDFSGGYTTLEGQADDAVKTPGYFERRRQAKIEARERREAEYRQKLEREVDRILAKVSAHGIKSLTAEENRILAEETKRQQGTKSS
ncbi:MAG TPA: site-2 protease family protein [Phycisphaerae bacterium]|nr:site-2 protease family protein [Phycisphaerae bacterium]